MDALQKMMQEGQRLEIEARRPGSTADELRAVMLDVANNLIASGAYASGPWGTMMMAIDELRKFRRPGQ